MTYDNEREFLTEAWNYLAENDYHSAELDVHHRREKRYLEIRASIRWGDWKHDHLYYGYLIEKWAELNGFQVLTRDHVCEVTEEDGSDCYSGVHRCVLLKPLA